jgi:hypothetical protein
MSNGTTTDIPVTLDLQTGMPPVYHSRSKELLYDSLMNSPAFIFNPFGPQQLNLSRPNHHW